MANYPIYTLAQEIAKTLQNEGKSEWAKRIEEAMALGVIGTEIQMALRWHLRQFLNEGHTSSPKTQLLINELLRELDSNLS